MKLHPELHNFRLYKISRALHPLKQQSLHTNTEIRKAFEYNDHPHPNSFSGRGIMRRRSNVTSNKSVSCKSSTKSKITYQREATFVKSGRGYAPASRPLANSIQPQNHPLPNATNSTSSRPMSTFWMIIHLLLWIGRL